MKTLVCIIMAAVISAYLAVSVFANPLEVHVFYQRAVGACAACDDLVNERQMRNFVRSVFAPGMDENQVRFSFFNLFHEGAIAEQFYEMAALAGADAESLEMPVFFTHDNHYFDGSFGLESLADHLSLLGVATVEQEEEPESRQVPYMPEGTVISPNRDDPNNVSVNDSVILYFYLPWCRYCYEISPIMDNLPEYVILPDGRRSNVRLIGLNWEVPEEGYWIEYYHEYLNILAERRLVPLIIVGNRDLFLYDEVSAGLMVALEAGEGLHTPLFVERIPEAAVVAIPWIPIVIAGAVLLCIIAAYKIGANSAKFRKDIE